MLPCDDISWKPDGVTLRAECPYMKLVDGVPCGMNKGTKYYFECPTRKTELKYYPDCGNAQVIVIYLRVFDDQT